MDALGDLVTRDRRSDAPALRAADAGREYDYRRFCTSAWKTGNYLRHLGVRSGSVVAVLDDPTPEAVLSFYGAAMLGGVVRFVRVDPMPDIQARALVGPTAAVEGREVPPGTQRVAYGEKPTDPSVGYFERDVWSENPTEPPDSVEAGDALLATAERSYTHREVLTAARTVVERWDLGPGAEVAVCAPFAEPGTVAAGLVAPVLAGAVVLLAGEPGAGDCAVGDGPESVSLSPGTVL